MRTIPELTKVFPQMTRNAIVVRATDNGAAFAEWLVRQLDLPAGIQPARTAAAYEYQAPGRGGSTVRVYYVSHAQSPQAFQETVNTHTYDSRADESVSVYRGGGHRLTRTDGNSSLG